MSKYAGWVCTDGGAVIQVKHTPFVNEVTFAGAQLDGILFKQVHTLQPAAYNHLQLLVTVRMESEPLCAKATA